MSELLDEIWVVCLLCLFADHPQKPAVDQNRDFKLWHSRNSKAPLRGRILLAYERSGYLYVASRW